MNSLIIAKMCSTYVQFAELIIVGLNAAVVHVQVAKCHIKLELKNDSFTELRGEIAGPPDTPYEGATYVLDIKIPETYPFNPPKVCCSL